MTLNILYRISPFLSSNPNPLGTNKNYILLTCLKSFCKSGIEKHKVTFLADSIEKYWAQKNLEPYGEVIHYVGKTRELSIEKMFEWAQSQKGKVFFIEDDYLWKEDIMDYVDKALNTFKLVSPYDHPDHYKMQELFKLKSIDGTIYRDSPSNTHTFATHTDYIREHWEVFKSGYWDHPMFTQLPDKVWNPIPSFATHLVTGLVAPGFKI